MDAVEGAMRVNDGTPHRCTFLASLAIGATAAFMWTVPASRASAESRWERCSARDFAQ